MLDYSLRIIIAAAAVGLVLVALRVRSGAARHAAWTAVLFAMLAMPVLTTVVPRIEVPVPSTLVPDPGTIAAQYANGASEDSATRIESALTRTSGTSAALQPLPVVPDPEHPRTLMDWLAPMLAIYVAGLFYFTARLAAGWRLARRLVGAATPTEIESETRVLESSAIAAPVTTGVLSPVVILPSTWREWPADTLRAVLAHEEAHVARRDCLVLLLAQINRCVAWFHPVSWWLERALAANSEHACDELVVRRTGEPRRYAEILVDMAAAVSVRGSRVAWPALGVDGSGLLGTRIDRLLRGDVFARMSLARRCATGAACAAILVAAIACRQQVTATPLRPDPVVQKSLAAQKERSDKFQSAASMTATDAARLESSLEQNPSDLDARERLLTYYRMSPSVEWNAKLTGTRKHVLWMIEHAPQSSVWIPAISRRHDPQGYEAAKKLWLEQTSRQDVAVQVLAKAADFLSAYDKPLAEELLLRARQRDPESTGLRAVSEPGIASLAWGWRLGELYGRAITGNVDRAAMAEDAAEATSPFAAEARRKLDATSDPQVLLAAARILTLRPGSDHRALGRGYLERAVQLDPGNVQARASLASAISQERTVAIGNQLRAAGARDKFDEFSDVTYAAVTALPLSDRLFYLPLAAESAYMRAESIEFTSRDKPEGKKAEAARKAKAGWDRSRKYAEDALELAAANTTAPEYGAAVYRANVALAVLALKDGDRDRALEYMARAGETPSSDMLLYSQQLGLRGRLVEYLLRQGERETVATFLEQSAKLSLIERPRLLKDAEQIRAGTMPQAYQYAEGV
jgi:beta-lactamase regulating signal transducer with metallopeptidase domain